MSENSIEFYSKVSKQSRRYYISIPLKLQPIAEKLHRKRVRVRLEVVE